MIKHRRRAANFTDSLKSIQHYEIDSTVEQSMSDDSLNVNLHTPPLRTQSVPDLNKRLNIHEIEQLRSKRGVIYNPQFCATNIDALDVSPRVSGNGSYNTRNQRSRRDSNYNVNDKSTQISQHAKPKITSMSQLVSLLMHSNKEKSNCDKSCKNDFDGQGARKFESILCSLDNQLIQEEGDRQSQQILKRLSDKYVRSPEKFTEKLLSVIEESVIHNDDESATNASAIDLSRLTTEFRKMCKFIEDESAPEWPLSPLSIPSCSPVSVSPACTKTINTGIHKNENLSSPISASLTSTPLSGADILRKRLFNKIGSSYNASADNIQNVSSNSTFEALEALCNKLYPNEFRKSLSEPSLLDMNQIHNICEQQMASLNNDHKSHKETTQSILDSSLDKIESKEVDDKSASTSYDNTSCSMKTYRKVYSDANGYTMVDPDELEKTLLQDIVEKRKRCLDTARVIAEINVDTEAIEAQRPSPTSLHEKNSLNNDETQFLRTLMSCKNYQTYLEERKKLPLSKLLNNSNPSTSEYSVDRIERHGDVEDLMKNTSGIGENEERSPAVKVKSEFRKPKYFCTPGKTPTNKQFKQKKKYFYSPVKENIVEEHIMESPNAEGLYRLNYTTVISPVGMYIRGLESPFIKNIRPKTNYESLTPLKNNVKVPPSRSLKLKTPRKSITKCQQETLPKFNLSPKIVSCNQKVLPEKTSRYESSPKNHCLLSKISNRRPLYGETIKEGTSTSKQVPRIKKLLENIENNKGRINSTQEGKRIYTCPTNKNF